jgi:hypothetical protein
LEGDTIKRWGLLLGVMLSSTLFAFVQPLYGGYVDFRYQYSNDTYKGTGTFSLENLDIEATFPLDQNYIIYYQTSIVSPSMEQFKQLYVELDQFQDIPINIRLGRFRIPFGNEAWRPKDKFYNSNSLMTDMLWSTSNTVVPKEETGIDFFYHSKLFSLDAYVVNGAGNLTERANDTEGKSFGVDMRFLARDLIQVGLSFYYADNGDPNNAYMLFGTDYEFSFYDFEVRTAYVLATGKESAQNKSGNIYHIDTRFHIVKGLTIGIDYSMSDLVSAANSKISTSLVYQINKDIVLKNEGYFATIDGNNDLGLIIQLGVSI